jgi:CRISPR-associated protein Cas5 subtype I-B
MRACQLKISGQWGHFKKPETNNNPLTHDFITKTAFVGLMGAVLGIERREMNALFPQLCTDLLYGVQLMHPVKKESHAFIVRNADLPGRARKRGERLLKPKHFEFLKDPAFLVSVARHEDRSSIWFDRFVQAVSTNEAGFTPVLGLHNCPADLTFVSEGHFSEKQLGLFEAHCFVSTDHILEDSRHPFHVGLDKIPTYQEDFWNRPDRYRTVMYPFGVNALRVSGEYYEYSNGERWWLI